MPTTEHHLVTGATGFVGGAMVLELLDKTPDRVSCLVRPTAGLTAQQRLHRSLRATATAYDAEHLLDQIDARCTAIPGDITRPGCGTEVDTLGRFDQIWHSAASLEFEDQRAEQINLHNVIGTQGMLDIARRRDVPVFNYVSTAYVCGTRSGVIPAQPDTEQQASMNNEYERSKAAAEQAVLRSGLPQTRIFRPSIVIGHSRTFATGSSTGLYGFLRQLRQLQVEVGRVLGDLLAFRSLRIRGEAHTRLNLIPVDAVARAAVGIATAGGRDPVYHLANTAMPTLADAMTVGTRLLGLRQPVFVDDVREFTSIDEQVDQRLGFYRSYLRGTKHFQVGNVEALLGAGILTYPMDEDTIEQYMSWYLDRRPAQRAA